MVYHARFANPLIQYGKKNFDLLILDDAENIVYRVSKSYPEDWTDEMMEADAQAFLHLYIQQTLESVEVDLPQTE